jgi:NAD(P)-dependent dehydrogenase (short-subunit alcohol dehydrogenase family)
MTSRHGRTALITGATAGIGRAAALELGRAGFEVLVVGRDQTRGKKVVRELQPAIGRFLGVDLQSIASIHRLAESVRETCQSLDLLVNNAGISPREKSMTGDGLERTFAVNTLAPFLLTALLIDLLSNARGRIVNVVTEVRPRTRIDIQDLEDPARYSTFSAYSRSKLALEMVTIEQARRYAGMVTVVGVHPGIVFETGLSSELPRWFVSMAPTLARMGRRRVSTTEEAGAAVARVATGAATTGVFYHEGEELNLPEQASDARVRSDLWVELERIAASTDGG